MITLALTAIWDIVGSTIKISRHRLTILQDCLSVIKAVTCASCIFLCCCLLLFHKRSKDLYSQPTGDILNHPSQEPIKFDGLLSFKIALNFCHDYQLQVNAQISARSRSWKRGGGWKGE